MDDVLVRRVLKARDQIKALGAHDTRRALPLHHNNLSFRVEFMSSYLIGIMLTYNYSRLDFSVQIFEFRMDQRRASEVYNTDEGTQKAVY